MQQVADQLNCEVQSVRRHIKAGRLIAVDIGNGKQANYRIAQAELDAFIVRQTTEPATAIQRVAPVVLKSSRFLDKVRKHREAAS